MEYTASTNSEGKHCVAGGGNGLGYYAHTLNPQLSCRDSEEARRAAAIANIAYKTGYETAKSEIRTSLGL